MAGIIEKKALEIADAVAENTEFVVVGAEYKKEGQDKYLRIYIDKTGGVGINECEEFSKAFDESFDKLELIDEAYILEVSSPGVDRILKTQREFDYYTGREVDVKLYKAIDGKKEFSGILKGFDGENAKIQLSDKVCEVPLKEADYIRLHFSF